MDLTLTVKHNTLLIFSHTGMRGSVWKVEELIIEWFNPF